MRGAWYLTEGCVCTTETISSWTFTMIALYCPPFLSLGFQFHVEASFCRLYVSLYRATDTSEIFSLILQNQIQIIP